MSDTTNRILWTIIGVLLVGAGTLAILATTGTWPRLPDDARLAPTVDDSRWETAPQWIIGVAVAAGVVLAVLGLWLLTRQFRSGSGASIDDVRTGSDGGRTRVDSSAVVDAWSRDVAGAPSIARARARLTGGTPNPSAWLRIDLTSIGGLREARDHVERSLERLAATSGWSPSDVDVTVRPARSDERVR